MKKAAILHPIHRSVCFSKRLNFFLTNVLLALGVFLSGRAWGASQLYLPFTNADALFGIGSARQPACPQSSLVIGNDGITLYGTATYGGSNNVGSIFGVSEDDSAVFFYHSFSTNPTDGSLSYSGLPLATKLAADGNMGGLIAGNDGWLYGTTPSGGTNNDGTLYRISQVGNEFQILHNFSTTDSYPVAPAILGTDGALYGTCFFGQVPGSGDNGGAIYRINTDGSGYAVLAYATNDLIYSGLLQASDGALYGNAANGTFGYSILFRLATNGAGFTYLYTNTTGLEPVGTLIQSSNGFLFGTCISGGTSNLGMIYMIDTNGENFHVVHNFSDGTVANDGGDPESGLVLAGGYFYGTTAFGGGSLGPGSGTIYRLAQDGSGYTPIYSFYTNTYTQYGQFRPSAAPTPGLFQGNTGAIFGSYQTVPGGGHGGVYGLLINPPATISPISNISGGEATITWPAWAASFTLQSTTNLTSGTWQTVTDGVPVLGKQVPATNSQVFYRLLSP